MPSSSTDWQPTPNGKLTADNQGDSLLPLDTAGGTIDQVSHTANQLRPDHPICLGRQADTADAH